VDVDDPNFVERPREVQRADAGDNWEPSECAERSYVADLAVDFLDTPLPTEDLERRSQEDIWRLLKDRSPSRITRVSEV
jgi:hypothetical protein